MRQVDSSTAMMIRSHFWSSRLSGWMMQIEVSCYLFDLANIYNFFLPVSEDKSKFYKFFSFISMPMTSSLKFDSLKLISLFCVKVLNKLVLLVRLFFGL